MKHLFEQHPGKTIALAIGLFFSLIYLFFGFWDMLFVGLLLAIAYNVGSKFDAKTIRDDAIQWVSWLNDRFKLFR